MYIMKTDIDQFFWHASERDDFSFMFYHAHIRYNLSSAASDLVFAKKNKIPISTLSIYIWQYHLGSVIYLFFSTSFDCSFFELKLSRLYCSLLLTRLEGNLAKKYAKQVTTNNHDKPSIKSTSNYTWLQFEVLFSLEILLANTKQKQECYGLYS